MVSFLAAWRKDRWLVGGVTLITTIKNAPWGLLSFFVKLFSSGGYFRN
jgi:hypothetical protein